MGERTKKRLVVKVGTNTLTGGEDRLSQAAMLGVARQIARLVRDGHQVALVSSGAIVAGRQALSVSRNGRDIPFKQVLAAVGQTKLMQMWDELFSKEDLIVAQTLLTRGDLADRQGYLNARNTLLALLERQVVPIINENDVVATEEIKIGDNDNLSALVANLIDADLLILLTDQNGLYTADPRRHSTATLIHEVPVISNEIIALAAGAGIRRGALYGKSDATGSSPAESPVHPTLQLATVYHSLGIEPHTNVYNHLNQPRELVQAEPVTGLFG